jgi:DNA polymerase-1
MKLAMIHLQPALDAAGLKALMLLQVHDELVLEVTNEELRATAKVVKQVMANAVTLSIPLLTEARSGVNWGSMQILPD